MLHVELDAMSAGGMAFLPGHLGLPARGGGGSERGQLHRDRMSYITERPGRSPNTVIRIAKNGATVLDANGYSEGKVAIEAGKQPDRAERLPESLRVRSGHCGSHTFLAHELVGAIAEDRHPSVNLRQAIAYKLPGIAAHQSALRGGESLKIRDYRSASA